MRAGIASAIALSIGESGYVLGWNYANPTVLAATARLAPWTWYARTGPGHFQLLRQDYGLAAEVRLIEQAIDLDPNSTVLLLGLLRAKVRGGESDPALIARLARLGVAVE